MSAATLSRLGAGAALLLACLAAVWLAGGSLAAAAIAFVAGLAAAALSLPLAIAGQRTVAQSGQAGPDEAWPGAVSDFIPEPLLVVAEGRIVQANAAARGLMGEQIVGRDVRLAIRHPAAVERLLTALPPGETEQAEIVGLGDPDRHWTMTIASLGDEHRLVRLVDRSEAHAAERMRVDFVANASHELRTPLATIVGFAETLRDPDGRPDPETLGRFFAIIHAEAKRMQRLIDDLISLSRIEAERFSTPQEAVSLPAVAREARDNHSHLARERSCEIRIDSEPDLPAAAGDRRQLLQLLDNLIGNALRYGRPGSTVSIAIRSAGDQLELVVSDEGEGIAQQHIPRLTERFYRVDPGRSRSVGGTGLGLSIVKHIVERHRGRLHIRSAPGIGTSVTVLLPADQGHLSSKSHESVTGISPSGPTKAADSG